MKALLVFGIVFVSVGSMLTLLGVAIKTSHWPDPFKSLITGPLFFALGIAFIISYFLKQK